MRTRYRRFFGGLLLTQERWLNRMAAKGLRLVAVHKLAYEFIPCAPGQYEYKVEYIGQKSASDAADYRIFLQDMGYTVFFKNINLNYSVGKVYWRPWAEKGGRIATNATTHNRELLIIGREANGTPFDLHTTSADKAKYLRALRQPWLFFFFMTLLAAVFTRFLVWTALAAVSLATLIIYHSQLFKLSRPADIEE